MLGEQITRIHVGLASGGFDGIDRPDTGRSIMHWEGFSTCRCWDENSKGLEQRLSISNQ